MTPSETTAAAVLLTVVMAAAGAAAMAALWSARRGRWWATFGALAAAMLAAWGLTVLPGDRDSGIRHWASPAYVLPAVLVGFWLTLWWSKRGALRPLWATGRPAVRVLLVAAQVLLFTGYAGMALSWGYYGPLALAAAGLCLLGARRLAPRPAPDAAACAGAAPKTADGSR